MVVGIEQFWLLANGAVACLINTVIYLSTMLLELLKQLAMGCSTSYSGKNIQNMGSCIVPGLNRLSLRWAIDIIVNLASVHVVAVFWMLRMEIYSKTADPFQNIFNIMQFCLSCLWVATPHFLKFLCCHWAFQTFPWSSLPQSCQLALRKVEELRRSSLQWS